MSVWTCPKCNREYPDNGGNIRCVCRAGGGTRFVERGEVRGGPGTELTAILQQLGISEKTSCNCRAVALQMNRWGVDGCRVPENHAWIVERLTANAEKYSWRDTITAATNLALHPSLWSAHFLVRMAVDGWIQALIKEAIKRAACVESAKL
mgnify:FL=1